ncbi:hypothetical protein [Caballeronia sp. LZ019]|uniref:hypothetical protein n=1 Tax=Caballeronia sp. LZ019 TaxID=3038555 RepID=UPI0028657EB5|nr:hypothetical protein [Caballeronia sp. LZ019]MDR5809524.1 hypothetical protein [Caballeronia sp. LZ019]
MAKHRNPDERQGEMFGNPAASAVWPSPHTVTYVLLVILLRGERVSQPDFKASWRLAAEAHRLRELGWPVISEPVSHAGTKRPIARYRLSPTAIAAARMSQGGAT